MNEDMVPGRLVMPVDPRRDRVPGGPSAAVTLVFRHFPLTEIHPHAQLAAEAAEEGAAQGKFWAMHDLLFHRQKALEADDLRRYAQEAGLDVDRFGAALGDGRHGPRTEEDVLSGVASGVDGTPALFINGDRYRGSYEAAILGPVLARANEGGV